MGNWYQMRARDWKYYNENLNLKLNNAVFDYLYHCSTWSNKGLSLLLRFQNNVLHVGKWQPKYFTYGKLFCLEVPFKWDEAGWKNHFLGSGGQTYQWVSFKISFNISKKKIFVLVDQVLSAFFVDKTIDWLTFTKENLMKLTNMSEITAKGSVPIWGK